MSPTVLLVFVVGPRLCGRLSSAFSRGSGSGFSVLTWHVIPLGSGDACVAFHAHGDGSRLEHHLEEEHLDLGMPVLGAVGTIRKM